MAVLTVAGCTSVKLSNALRDPRFGGRGETAPAMVSRAGASLRYKPGMSLEASDIITTDSTTAAVIDYPSGTRVYLRPDTEVRIGSIFVFIGEIFVRAKGLFAVETEFVTAASEGTEYLVRVERGSNVSVSVAEGLVGIESTLNRWPKVTLAENDRADTSGPRPSDLANAAPDELNEIIAWAARIDRWAGPRTGANAGGRPPFDFDIIIGFPRPGGGRDSEHRRRRDPNSN